MVRLKYNVKFILLTSKSLAYSSPRKMELSRGWETPALDYWNCVDGVATFVNTPPLLYSVSHSLVI